MQFEHFYRVSETKRKQWYIDNLNETYKAKKKFNFNYLEEEITKKISFISL